MSGARPALPKEWHKKPLLKNDNEPYVRGSRTAPTTAAARAPDVRGAPGPPERMAQEAAKSRLTTYGRGSKMSSPSMAISTLDLFEWSVTCETP